MTDIELTEKIKNLKWTIDFKRGICESEFIRYRIINGNDYTDLKAEWISPLMPTVASVILKIQQGAVDALKEAKGETNA